MISIKHRHSGTTLCEFGVETVKQAAEKGKANLYGANLYGANLREADLREANLRGAHLYGANLYGADLYGADLRGADLREANLCGANLYGADLYGANLRGVNLRGANLYGADLYGADLYGADLYGANLYVANLCGAIIDYETVSKTPIQIPCGLKYVALITDGYMRLGCKRYKHSEWAAFSDEQISEMDSGALEFWKQWKEPLLAMCRAHVG